MNTQRLGQLKVAGMIIFSNALVLISFTYLQQKGYGFKYNLSKKMTTAENSNQYRPYKQYLKTLCELDKTRIAKFENTESLTPNQSRNLLHEIVMDPINLACHSKQRFGGSFLDFCKFTDGGKVACMDDLLEDIRQKKCLIFSFGINADWTFEDMMDKLGCTIHAFDPTVDYPKTRGNHITFEKLGVSAKPDMDMKLDTLSSILNKYNHQDSVISYLKIDIELSELEGLPAWLASGALSNVQQIAVEIHLTEDVNVSVNFLKTLKKLYNEGNFRLISYEPNGCYRNVYKGQDKYYRLFEIVLKKVSENHKVIERNCDRYLSL